jgi:hypothetical protein
MPLRRYHQFWRTFVKCLNKWLVGITLISFTLVLSKRLVPSPAGSIVTNISYNVIAAFIFYLFIDLLPTVRSTRELVPYVTRQITLISGDIFSVCQEAARLNGTQITDQWRFNSDDVERFFKGLNTHTEANMVSYDGKKVRFIDFLAHHGKRTEEWLGNLSRAGTFSEGEGAARIAELYESTYLKMLGQIAAASQFRAFEISSFASVIIDHHKRWTHLRDWSKQRGLFVEGAAWNPW